MQNAFSTIFKYSSRIAIAGCIAATIGGCAALPKSSELELSREALARRDYVTAQSAAETYIAAAPSGELAAEAYYLKGRAIEDRTAGSPNEARQNLQDARTAYIAALTVGTDDRGLEGLIRASLADVAYWQEDFSTAAEQGQVAYTMLTDDTVRAWTLYRTGVSLQRLGKFEEADQTLSSVEQSHPSSEPAMRAHSRVGVRSFNVQAATFANAGIADTAITNLQRQGITASKRTTDTGKTVIMVGPFASYTQAATMRAKLASIYPGALIVP